MTVISVAVTRGDLGLGDLDINDGVDYKVSNEILGGQVTWERNAVSSPYVNGDITVHRRRPSVQERFAVYAYGANQTELRDNVKALIDAFNQDTFNLTVSLDSIPHTYQCEAADVQIEWSNVHLMSNQVRVVFTVPRKPISLAGF